MTPVGIPSREFPGPTRDVPSPVAKLGQGRGVTGLQRYERLLGRQMDFVRVWAVEGSDALVVLDERTGILKESPGFLSFRTWQSPYCPRHPFLIISQLLIHTGFVYASRREMPWHPDMHFPY